MDGAEEARVAEMLKLQKEQADKEGMVEYGQHKVTEETKAILEAIQEKSFEDFAFGSMIGAFVADSMGSLVEFIECEVPQDKLDQVMTMPGGGPHSVGPGQITDDSEMAMCMLHALTNTKKVDDGVLTFEDTEKVAGKGTVDMNAVGKWYRKWICDEPFDLGITT